MVDADDDWIESFRAFYYPKLHPYLNAVGGYGVGTCSENQYTTTLSADEKVIEKELEEIGFIRNPIACYKSTHDGRNSEGSWVLLHEDDPGDFVKEGYQLHITLFRHRDRGRDGREVYAHHEPDWRQTPLKHLSPMKYPGVVWETEKAADYMNQLLTNKTFFDTNNLK